MVADLEKDILPRINANKHESKISCVAPLGLNSISFLPTLFGFACARLQGGLTSQRASGADRFGVIHITGRLIF